MDKSKRIVAFIPLFLSLALAVGFAMGHFFSKENIGSDDKKQLIKLKTVVDYIDENYVDEIDRDALMEDAISAMLEELDPHSAYIPSHLTTLMNEQLSGALEGIGVQFSIYNDTLMVLRVVDGGPSKRAGVLAGDRILKVDGELLAEDGISNKEVMDKLKGKRGSKVELEVLRSGEPKTIHIMRGRIPLFAIDSYYMLNDLTGYIQLTKFSKTSADEFFSASKTLKSRGMKKLVLDLRGNTGGYLDQVEKIVNAFLEKGDLIVYTQGKNYRRKEARAKGDGWLKNTELVVLIDEQSASASEILAGAIQDHDRGHIIGRRSFGKGLVQNPKAFDDGSELRLTVARYYTPVGRSIQKPYGTDIDYRQDVYNRQENGELYALDSGLMVDSLKYLTLKLKRSVYGGGGIMPDIFVPLDSSNTTSALNYLSYYVREFNFYHLDTARKTLYDSYASYKVFGDEFEVDSSYVNRLVGFAESNVEFRINRADIETSLDKIKLMIKADLASNLYGAIGRSYALKNDDVTLQKGIEVIGTPLE